MKNFRIRILKAVTALALIAAVAAGMTAALGKKAEAGGSAPGTYRVTFYGNGGKVIDSKGKQCASTYVDVAGGNYITSLKASISCCGTANFLGWSTSKSSNKITYPVGSPIKVNGDMNLYAVFKKVDVHYHIPVDGYFVGVGYNNRPDQITLRNQCPCTKLLSAANVCLSKVTFDGWVVDYEGYKYANTIWRYSYSIGQVMKYFNLYNDNSINLRMHWK